MITYHTGKQKTGKAFKKSIFFLLSLVTLGGCQTSLTPPAPVQHIEMPPVAAQKKNHAIGVLLPLSGKASDIGADLWKGAEMALLNSDKENVTLYLKDTAGTAAGTIRALKELESVPLDAIVGPLFAADVRALSTAPNPKSIPILALSSDTSLARRGIFVLGLSPQDQLHHVLSFAKEKGRDKVAALLPHGVFGDSMETVLTQTALNDGWTISGIIRYDSAQPLLAEQIATLKNAAFDTLVLPVGGTELGAILKSLRDENVALQDTFVLGTGAWDDTDLPKYLLPPLSYYAAPNPKDREEFVFSFEKTYGQKPNRITTLTYDAVSLLTGLLTEGGSGSLFDRLTNPAGFDGVDGYFRLNQNGSVKRTLVIMNGMGDLGV